MRYRNFLLLAVAGLALLGAGPSGAFAQAWEQMPGRALEISQGANGAVWAIGTDAVPGGCGIWYWNSIERTWQRSPAPAAAVKIAVAPNGLPWVINSAGDIFYHDGNGFRQVAGKAREISIGANGTVWVVGADELANGYAIYRYNGAGGWDRFANGAVKISVGPTGLPWVVNSLGDIYYHDGSGFRQVAGKAREIAVGVDGTAYVIGTDQGQWGYGIWRLGQGGWTQLNGQATKVAALNGTALWVINADGTIFQAQATGISIRKR